jgi:acyl-CoA synthetase (NDP forming)
VVAVTGRGASHKTEAGGVVPGVADEAALRRAWGTLTETSRAQLASLDGTLVEAMRRAVWN